MSREKVLSLLLAHRGEPISGEVMSRQLGVSRAAVWKAVEALRREGYLISSAPNRGYSLEQAPDLLREGELSGPLKHCLVGRQLLCLDTVDSTNTECKRQALAGTPEGLVVLAEEQTGGRGRRGRSFQSPRGKGLYLPALLRPRLEPKETINFTAWVAVAVCDAIEKTCGFRPQIKWTNDLVYQKKKLVGILTEMGLENESNSLQYMVPGIGINVNQTEDDFDPEIRSMAGSLFQIVQHTVRRTTLASEVILALDRMYAAFPQKKAEYLARYRADCMTPGQHVQLITPTSRREAFAEAIDDDFRLVVRLPDGTREAIASGEVSVRGMYGYV